MSNISDNKSHLSDVFKVFSELSEILKKNELTEIEYSNDKESFVVKKQSGGSVQFAHSPMAHNSMQVVSPSGQSTADSIVSSSSPSSPSSSVKSPMVGVAYLAPSPNDENFVKVGDAIKKGQTVMIVEAMKVMNEVRSDKDGVVSKICVNSGDVVEFGQPLIELS